MSSGRFDSKLLLYSAGKRARERGRVCSKSKFEHLEDLRKQMSYMQKDPLVDPSQNPAIVEGMIEAWKRLKIEYDTSLKAENTVETTQVLTPKEINKRKTVKVIIRAENRRRNYQAAVKSSKKHINDCIQYAKKPLRDPPERD